MKKTQLSQKTIEKIRKAVKDGKPKMQVLRELNLSPKLVYYHTKDIIVGYPQDLRIAGNTLDLLQQIMKKGYTKSSTKYNYQQYQKIRLKF